MSRTLQDIRNFTVRIQNSDTHEPAGTGFIIHTDGHIARIVTAAHVISAIFGVEHACEAVGKEVEIDFPQVREIDEGRRKRVAKIEACLENYDDDVVVLRMEGGDPRPPLYQNQAILGTAAPSRKNPYISYGFPGSGAYPESTIDGQIVNLIPSKLKGQYHYEVVELEANSTLDKIKKGMSGAAVLDKYRNLVIGIVTSFIRRSSSNLAWAADCRVLTFDAFCIDLLQDENPSGTPLVQGEAFDRGRYNSLSRPGLELVDAPEIPPQWVGRKDLLRTMGRYWEESECKLLELVGFGGQGKSSLARKWLEFLASDDISPKPVGIFWWDFYNHKDLDEFAEKLLGFVSVTLGVPSKRGSLYTKLGEIKKHIHGNGFLIILDGFEVMQFQTGDRYGEIKDNDLSNFMDFLASDNHQSYAIVTSRVPIMGLINRIFYKHLEVDEMSVDDGVMLLKKMGVRGSGKLLASIVDAWAGHPLTLTLLGSYIFEKHNGKVSEFFDIPIPEINEPQYERLRRVLFRYDQFFNVEERRFLQIFCAFRSAVDLSALEKVFRNKSSYTTALLANMDANDFAEMIERLVKRGFIRETTRSFGEKEITGKGHPSTVFNVHPLIADYFYRSLSPEQKTAINLTLREYVRKIKIPRKPRSIEQLRPAIDEVYYLCEVGFYDEAYRTYQQKVWRKDDIPEDETGYITTVLSGYQADMEVLRNFFPEKDITHIPRLSDPSSVADLLIVAGVDLDTLGNPRDAIVLYEKSAQIGIEVHDWNYATWSYQNIGTALISLGNFREGLKKLELAFRYASKSTDWIKESNASLVKIAWAECLLGKINAADKALAQAKKIFIENELNESEVQSFEHSLEGSIVAEVLVRTGRYEAAMEVSRKNLAFLNRNKIWKDDCGCHRVIGMIYEGKGQNEKAMAYYHKAVKLIHETGMREETILSLLRRGSLSIQMQEWDRAEEDLYYALSLAQSCQYIWEIDLRNAIIRLALARGDASRRHREFLFELAAINQKSIETGYKWAEVDSLLLLSHLNNLNGNLHEAIGYFERAQAIQKIIQDPRMAIASLHV